MHYHPVRRVAAFLAACAVLGVPAGLYIGQFQYDAFGVLTLVAGGFMVVLLLAFGVFAVKSANDIPVAALNILRLLAIMLAITLAGIVTLVVPGHAVGTSAVTWQDPVSTKYTNWVDVDDCTPISRTGRTVHLALRVDGDVCTAVLPIRGRSVVAVPDNVLVTLKNLSEEVNSAAGTLTLTFPVNGDVNIFVLDSTDGAHLANRPGWAIAGGLPMYTITTA